MILPEAPFQLLEKDFSELSSQERERELGREIQEEAGTRFDLSSGPLIRGRLLKQAADEHVLLLGMHHIVSDGWSLGVLVKELSTLYAAYREGEQRPALETEHSVRGLHTLAEAAPARAGTCKNSCVTGRRVCREPRRY